MRPVCACALLLVARMATGEEQQRQRRGAKGTLLSALKPPSELALSRVDALRLLSRVDVLGEDGAWSLDIGGSLAKVAFFRRRDPSQPSCAELLAGCPNLAAESLHVPALGGDIHFLLFQTKHVQDYIDFVERHWVRGQCEKPIGGLRRALRLDPASEGEPLPRREVVMRATGGGSVKYRAAFERIGVTLRPRDEMRSMVHGLNFLLANVQDEAFSVDAGDPLSPLSPERAAALPPRYLPPQASPNPYLFVSIGSGVSIIEVTGYGGKFRRVDGSSIGGGTFWGLCRLLLQCGSFDELIALTERGVSSNVDMLVGDIYGGDCTSHNVQLNKDVIAASFGKVVMRHECSAARRAALQLASTLEDGALRLSMLLAQLPLLSAVAERVGLRRLARRRRARLANSRLSREFRAEDIALSLLRLVSNNVGQLACLNAQKHGLTRIFFGGSFIRNHPYTVATLSNAVKFFSKGTCEAHFLKREGFVGALGALLDGDEPLVDKSDGREQAAGAEDVEDGAGLFGISSDGPSPIPTRSR
ncbi:fumble-domain-containing protein [Pavlovales sp. CCMP2436]|nr:fumble-domain-containing protein [Pavlovales sp. CCMP2436]